MTMQTGKSSIVERYGSDLNKAFLDHKNDTPVVNSFGELPDGLEGTARLVDIKFDRVEVGKNKKHEGEFYFYAAGVVVDPQEFYDKQGNLRKVAGKRTSVIEMLCNTPEKTGEKARKTIQQHFKWVMDLCKLSLGINVASMKNPKDLENAINAINVAIKKKEGRLNIFFNFQTWKGQKQTTGEYANKEPKVNHTWLEHVPNFQMSNNAASAMQDSSATVADEPELENENEQESEETTPPTAKKPSANGSGKKPPKKSIESAEDEQEENDEGFADNDDLDSLAERADAQPSDSKAVAKLTAFAKEAGISKDVLRKAETWAEIVEMMKEKTSEAGEVNNDDDDDNNEENEDEENEEEDTGEDEPEEEEEQVPEVDKVVKYHPLNKENKPFKNPVECVILEVNEKEKTVKIQNMGNQKVYKDIPWDKIKNSD